MYYDYVKSIVLNIAMWACTSSKWAQVDLATANQLLLFACRIPRNVCGHYVHQRWSNCSDCTYLADRLLVIISFFCQITASQPMIPVHLFFFFSSVSSLHLISSVEWSSPNAQTSTNTIIQNRCRPPLDVMNSVMTYQWFEKIQLHLFANVGCRFFSSNVQCAHIMSTSLSINLT